MAIKVRDYEVRLTRNKDERRQVRQLRYDVFVEEEGASATDEQKNFFKENYQYLRELNNKPNTIFEATAYNQDRSSVWRTCVDNLDQFYELLHINKTYKLK